MKQIFGATILAFFLAATLSTAEDQFVPKNWRLPTKMDEKDDWVTFATPERVPYCAQADFNGDGILDQAYIALSTTGKGWALFVNLNGKKSKPVVIKLDEDHGETPPQRMGISVADPGKYKTACGKGYSRFEKSESPELELKLPAIDYHVFESANSFFWWDVKAGKFRRTWMSD